MALARQMYAGYATMKIASEAGMNCFDSKKADKTAQKTIIFDIVSTAWLCFCYDIFNCVIEVIASLQDNAPLPFDFNV